MRKWLVAGGAVALGAVLGALVATLTIGQALRRVYERTPDPWAEAVR